MPKYSAKLVRSNRTNGAEVVFLREYDLTPGQIRAEGAGADLRDQYHDVEFWERDARLRCVRSLYGRRKLLTRAMDTLRSPVPSLPYNMGWKLPTSEWVEGDDAQAQAIVDTARFAGWIEAVALQPQRHRTLIRLFRKLFSQRGIGSPHNRLDGEELFRLTRLHSPGRANALARKVVARTDGILSPYGLRVSNRAVMSALLAGRVQVGKLSRIAAELTAREVLRGLGLCFEDNYAQRRIQFISLVTGRRSGTFCQKLTGFVTALEALRGYAAFRRLDDVRQAWAVNALARGEFCSLRDAIAAIGRLVADSTDGVEGLIDPMVGRSIRGVTVRRMWTETVSSNRRRVSELWVVTTGSMTYHSGAGDWRDAVRAARSAWIRQGAAAKAEVELEAFLRGDHPRVSVLVLRRHSYAAGNCQPGTEAWIRTHGFSTDLQFIPLRDLWTRAVALADSRARNTCHVAAQEALRQLA